MAGRADTTVDTAEIAHFARDSARWWDEDGPFRPLHRLNPIRISYIRDRLCARFGRDPASLRSLEGLKILDAGCGGGLACEPLARLGAKVTGIDADASAIQAARAHAGEQALEIDYRAATTGDLARGGMKEKFDAVLALEIIEHVAAPEQFVHECVALCRPGGLVIFSTLNRTPKSFALGIVAAEYILGWVPRGTHSWKKFVRPSELAALVRAAGAAPADQAGLVFSPRTGGFALSKTDMDVNYFQTAEKPAR
jgi:2-polyprenyl-6-hydroxyphenyl methylase/3-demethylubiquinone-9 3-methyltransferase